MPISGCAGPQPKRWGRSAMRRRWRRCSGHWPIPNQWVRRAVAEALGKIGDASAVEALQKA
ncbi:hypothetical protein, partial [Chloroflexus aurantiacus]